MQEYKMVEGKFLKFQGKPLLRENNILCYGDTNDAYVLFMIILSEKTVEIAGSARKVSVPDKILAQILSTDFSKPSHERIAKQFEKDSLYEALDLGTVWLNKMNKTA